MKERRTDPRMPPLVNIAGAAEILGVAPQYVHRLAEDGRLPGAKHDHAWVFRRVVVERLRKQRQGDPGL